MPRIFSGKVILYLLILHAIDLCLTPFLGVWRPILLYLWVLYVAFYGPVPALIPAAIMAGLLRDLSGSQPLGVETLSLTAMAASITFLILKFEHEFFLMRVILVFLFVFFGLLLNIFLTGFLAPGTSLTWYAFYASFCVSLVSTLVMPIFFAITRKWFPSESNSLKQYELFG